MKSIYISLDSILDTRLAFLIDMSPKLASHIYLDNYINRFSDNFSIMNNLEFKERYKNRTKNILKTPLPTLMLGMLEYHAIALRQQDILQGGDGKVKIYLNLYPYEFSSYEEKMISGGIKSKLIDSVSIEIVYDYNVSPTFIKENINTLILYDGIEWVEKNVRDGKLKTGDLIHVELIVPDAIDTPFNIAHERDVILQDLSTMFVKYIDLTFISISTFSTQINLTKDSE